MALDKIEVEFENIQLAWDLLITKRQWRELRIFANALWLFAEMRSQLHETHAMLKQAVDAVRDEVRAMLGHFDRTGGGNTSWNSAHASRGCSQPNLVATGGAGLIYCFAAN